MLCNTLVTYYIEVRKYH